MAKAHYELRRFQDALASLGQAMKESPQDWEAYYLTGLIYEENRAPDKALPFLFKAWSLSPGKKEVGDLLTRSCKTVVAGSLASGGVQAAREQLEQAIIRRGFYSIELVRQLMEIYARQKEWASVVRLGDRLLEKRARREYHPRSGQGLQEVYLWIGRAQLRLGRLDQAQEALRAASISGERQADRELENVRAAFEARARPHLERATEAFREERFERARLHLQQAMEVYPDSISARKMLLRIDNLERAGSLQDQARAALEEGRSDEALGLLREALSLDPESPKLIERIRQVEERVEEEKRQRAVREEALRKARRDRQKRFAALVQEARGHEKGERYSQALALYREALRLFPEDRQIQSAISRNLDLSRTVEQYRQGLALEKDRKWAEAVRAYLSIPGLEDGFRDVRKRLARAQNALNRFEEAERYALLAIEDDPRDVESLYLLGELFSSNTESKKRLAQAREYFLKVEEIEPGYRDAAARARALFMETHRTQFLAAILFVVLYLVGYLFIKWRPAIQKRLILKEIDRLASRSDWASLVEMEPRVKQGLSLLPHEEVQVFIALARAFHEERQPTRAVALAQKALRHSPNHRQGRLVLARALYASKTITPDSLPYYMDLLEAEPDNKNLLRYVGGFCSEKKLVNPTTLPVLRSLASAEPENDSLRALLIRTCIKEDDRSPSALALYRVEAERNPDNLDVKAILADDHLRRGDVDRAIEMCEEILNVSLNHYKTHQILHAAYDKMGKLDSLALVYQEILKADPHNSFIHQMHEKVSTNRIPIPDKAELTGTTPDDVPHPPPPAADQGPTCPKCGKSVDPGVYFCECGTPL